MAQIKGLGEEKAKKIVEARNIKPFTDLQSVADVISGGKQEAQLYEELKDVIFF